MLQQGLDFEVILTFHLDGLRWSSIRASRDVFLQLGHIEDVVDLLKPAREVKSICLRIFEDNSTFSPTRCSYSLWACQSSISSSPVLSSSGFWRTELLTRYAK